MLGCAVLALGLTHCGDAGAGAEGFAATSPTGGSEDASTGTGAGVGSPTTSPGTTADAPDDDAGGDDAVFDVGGQPDGGPPHWTCDEPGDGQMKGDPCEQSAPPDAFEPDVQWAWTGSPRNQSVVTPLVANLTDDSGDGVIDVCDIPDVIVTVFGTPSGNDGRIVVLSGDDGSLHFEVPTPVNLSVTPAVGDIDGDGVPEIIAVGGSFNGTGPIIAFDHTGAVLWTSATNTNTIDFGAPALADLEGDGSVEILVGGGVYESDGTLRFQTGHSFFEIIGSLVTAADLDGDGVQEVVHGAVAYRADGSLYYDAGIYPGFPQIGNFDDDDDPEIIVMNPDGINLLDHHGVPLWTAMRPTGDSNEPATNWLKPGTIHDFDGDGMPEFATGSANNYTVYEITNAGAAILWQATVSDISGSAGGTAFDFDGDGIAEAMYADETQLFVFDGVGIPLLTAPRQSGTGLEYPVVADIDNDGSAEIVVVSNSQKSVGGSVPTVQAIRDIDDRWIQARRIWNQHTYSVSNVNEDGTIPSTPGKSWLELNTFRTNAQIENGGICQPIPRG